MKTLLVTCTCMPKSQENAYIFAMIAKQTHLVDFQNKHPCYLVPPYDHILLQPCTSALLARIAQH